MTLPWPTPINSSTRRPSRISASNPPPNCRGAACCAPTSPSDRMSPNTMFVYPGTGFPKIVRWPWPVLWVRARAADAGGQRRDALQHRLAGERLSDGEQQCGEAERREDHGQRPFRRGHHAERVLEPPVDRADQGGERVVGGQVGPFVGVADRQHVVARDAPQLGAHPDRGGAVRCGGATRVRDLRLGGFALDRYVDPTPLALELLEQRASHRDQAVE